VVLICVPKTEVPFHFKEILGARQPLVECKHDRIEHLAGDFSVDGVILCIVNTVLVLEYLVKEH
jgi:hypothetical protein